MRTALVGRERELAALSDCLEDALFGQPRLVVCRGEPGIGKTRLAQEVCNSAADKDVVAVWGRADDSAGAPPYWPWRQMLRGMSTIADTAAIAEEHRLTTDLSPLAPDLFAEIVDQPTGSASIEDRFRQFDAVRELLRQVTLRRPLVIDLPEVIDSLDVEHPRMRAIAGDFFKDALPAADAYVLMEVLHDWPERECVEILAAIRRAAHQNSTLLVVEGVLPEDHNDPRAATLDLIMLTVTGGRERTASQMSGLFEQAGFRLDRVTDTASPMRIVEGSPV